jgi:predicted nucleic acid-binding protein
MGSSVASRRPIDLNLTIDTFAWVELIRGGRQAARAREAVEQADLCLTPSIVLAEVAAVCVRDGLADEIIREELGAIRETCEIVPIDVSIAMAAAHLAEQLRRNARTRGLPLPGLADGLVLATARASHSSLLTGDLHFRDCPETVWLA